MNCSKLLLFVTVLVAISAAVSAGLINQIKQDLYSFVKTKDGYHLSFDDQNGGTREEKGVFKNAGTPEEQLVVSGTYTVYDNKTDTETITKYTADEGGYNSQYMIKNRKLSANLLKSGAGGG